MGDPEARRVYATPAGSGRIAAMKIAQIAPPWITVPPEGYGGTEWVVKHLCDGLVAAGHDVHAVRHRRLTHAGARCAPSSPTQMPQVMGPTPLRRAARGRSPSPRSTAPATSTSSTTTPASCVVAFSRYLATCRSCCTPCTAPSTRTAYRLLRAVPRGGAPTPSISDFQRTLGPPGMNWAGTVYNALPVDGWPFSADKDDYLLAFGRICEDKGFHLAIEIARRTGRRLVMAGVVQDWYARLLPRAHRARDRRRADRLSGEVSDERKRELFAGARRLPLPHPLARAVRPRDDRGHGRRARR